MISLQNICQKQECSPLCIARRAAGWTADQATHAGLKAVKDLLVQQDQLQRQLQSSAGEVYLLHDDGV